MKPVVPRIQEPYLVRIVEPHSSNRDCVDTMGEIAMLPVELSMLHGQGLVLASYIIDTLIPWPEEDASAHSPGHNSNMT